MCYLVYDFLVVLFVVSYVDGFRCSRVVMMVAAAWLEFECDCGYGLRL